MSFQEGMVASATTASLADDENLRLRRTGKATNEPGSLTGADTRARRASSIMSDSSIGLSSIRHSIGASTDDHPYAQTPAYEDELHQEPTLWYSVPLLFAILPAIGGVAFKRGSVLLTDLALLGLAALYLHWCLLTPWVWYHSAQSIRLAGRQPQDTFSETVVEEEPSVAASESPNDKSRNLDDMEGVSTSNVHVHAVTETVNGSTEQAIEELRTHELVAMALCFLGPLVGSYILHLVRSQLSQIGDELVSNLHLTLFVLAAEIRPLRYLFKMVHARTVHLQRVVREDPHTQQKSETTAVGDISRRVDDIEKSYADMAERSARLHSSPGEPSAELVKKAQASLQNQIDALNRAVRRYEKRATAQTIQNEARLHDLEARLREAVSLAAAAANYSQKSGGLSKTMNKIGATVLWPLNMITSAITSVLCLLSNLSVGVLERLGLVKIVKRRRFTKLSAGAAKPFPNVASVRRTNKK